jgi:uncharacterized protein YjbI with pentapeptide repeats
VLDQPKKSDLRVMPWWLVGLGLIAAVILGWIVIVWLLGEANQGTTRAQLRIDAIRTGLTVVAGTGGAVALLLAARRQWINERAQRHEEIVAAQEREHGERVQSHAEAVAAATQRYQEEQARISEHDATERRVTELYTKAVDQLGSPQAAVRLGGLYALERLAQDNARQRRTITAVVCAYLRMPAADDDPQETQVRRTAQRLLTQHLKPADEQVFWSDVRIDLAGAQLVDFDASGCAFVDAYFTGAVFTGQTLFVEAVSEGTLRLGGASFESLDFNGVRCHGDTTMDDAVFGGRATFKGTVFAGTASFLRTHFAGTCSFSDVTFQQTVSFDRARFDLEASFSRAVVERGFSMEHASFDGEARFSRTRFADMALIRWTTFRGDVSFQEAIFEGAVNFGRTQFHRTARFDRATLRHRPFLDQARAAAAGPHSWPSGVSPTRVDDDWLIFTDD